LKFQNPLHAQCISIAAWRKALHDFDISIGVGLCKRYATDQQGQCKGLFQEVGF